ncbi:MAG TPA: glycoside hydrolase family 18 protein [bacterium]|nr:glycoside hydrolase family 18 protein [bacterium]
MKLLILIALLLLVLWPALAQARSRLVVLGYSAEWYDDKVPPAQYHWENLTHLARAFLEPNADGSLRIPPRFFDPLLAENAKKHGVKLLASIGGESAGNTNWKAIAADPAKTQKFLDQLDREVGGRGWDGVDIDWEPSPINDQEAGLYLRLMTAIHQRFPRWTLTTALMAGDQWVAHVPWRDLVKKVDFVNLMTYPLAGPWMGHSAHQTNLYPSDRTSGKGEMNVDGLVRNLLDHHRVPSRKIVLGLVFWAMKFPTQHLGEKLGTLKEGDMGGYPASQVPDLEKDPDYRKFWDEKAGVPYLERIRGGKATVSFEDPRSIRLKLEYARKKKLGGVMFWHIGSDMKDGRALLQDVLSDR